MSRKKTKNEEIELKEEQRDKLTQLILDRYESASAARSEVFYRGKSIDQWSDEIFNRYMSNNDCEGELDLVRIKTTVLSSKVQDMVINSVDAPFVVTPTPIPSLSKEQTESVQLDVEELLAKKLIESGVVIQDPVTGEQIPNFNAIMEEGGLKLIPEAREWLREQAKKQRKTVEFKQALIAREACDKVSKLMQDQLYEGDWRTAYLDFFRDFSLYGTGCIRQEMKQVKSLKWNGEKLAETTNTIITWRHVPFANCYPSADSSDANSGTYFIERASMRKQDLWACTDIDWIKEDKIEEAYEKAKENFKWLDESAEKTSWGDDDYIDVIIHEGVVKGDVLKDYIDSDKIKSHKFYDVEAMVVAGVCIGARLIEYLKGNRSYYSAQYMLAGSKFWGLGVAMLLAKTEDRLNDYIKKLDDNVDKTVSPPIFYDASQFESADDIDLNKKNRLIAFNPDVTGQRAGAPYYQVRFDSHSGEIVNLFNMFYRLTDDICGIPALLSGNSQQFGGESTFRGMKMLANTANTIVKASFLNIDKTVLQPLIENLWRWNMLMSKDESIKADVRVVARGAAGLMQKEIADAERTDVLPVIAQLIQGAGLDQQTNQNIVQYLLFETMKSGGLPAEQLMGNPDQAKELNAFSQSLKPSLAPATPEPTIGEDNSVGGLTTGA
ncbi:hypothetical protein HPC38_02330 [Pasteurellaceae bacterium HPA106]|uniref:hypothetical protein n=1 Tax=Spirabiliibacterium pneumoniae TaxID=221400 RepID=UPI001AAD16E5|nr:hypothetical protein [Spirabiliibacterium pneumoniae]MBE2895716.1 hypothetical protein [Spirabiliibacterium pneumoniae]